MKKVTTGSGYFILLSVRINISQIINLFLVQQVSRTAKLASLDWNVPVSPVL